MVSVPAMKLVMPAPSEPRFERGCALLPEAGMESALSGRRYVGVYLLIGHGERVVYAGQSRNMLRRIFDHCAKSHDDGKSLVLHLGARAGVSLDDDLSAAEDACILLLRPKHNRCRAPWTSAALVSFWVDRLRKLLADAAIPTVEPDLTWRPLTTVG